MPESKIEATHRLQRDGRWTAACEFRDKVRRELRQAGKTKGEANDEAWRRMSEEFPPVVVAQAQQGQSADDLLSDDDDDLDFPTNLRPSDVASFDADMRWAWNTIGDPVQPEDAPNGSAWCLHMFAIQQFDKFLPLVVKSIGVRDKGAKSNREDRDRQFKILDVLAAEFESQKKESVPQGPAVTPGNTVGAVR